MSTPAHHQNLTLCGTITVLLKHPAGDIRGAVLRVDVGGGEPLSIAVLADQWPPGVCQGALLWVRGRLANEAVRGYRRATHFIRAEHLALVRGPKGATA